ncbi:hypothetical protein EYZ11_013220 [Aspergillus tanneri]|uniref:Uncharacterized protein n=1 Tax=Aspergillus tanneri TaxID=1220188 RepID=A0A4S3J3M8_9EURO|nr:hypothetical protein EYZ11_013220 [Aspergillus tanneri]
MAANVNDFKKFRGDFGPAWLFCYCRASHGQQQRFDRPSELLQYLSDPGIKSLCNGQFLERILVIILEPRTLWNAWMEAFASRMLDDIATYVQAMVNDGALFRFPSTKLRQLGHKQALPASKIFRKLPFFQP